MNKTRLWDHLISLGMANTFFALGHNLAPFREPMLDTLALLVGMSLWGIGVTGVKRQDRAGHGEPPAPIERFSAPDLNKAAETPSGWIPLRHGVKLEYTTVSVREKKLDPRLKQWAFAVAYNNAPITQKKWGGRKRLFSRPEYERWMAELLKREIVTFVNPRDPSRGYRPNGVNGWKKIRDIANGKDYIPLPAATLSEAGVRYVSARMRERSGVGQGRDEENER